MKSTWTLECADSADPTSPALLPCVPWALVGEQEEGEEEEEEGAPTENTSINTSTPSVILELQRTNKFPIVIATYRSLENFQVKFLG